MSRAKHFKLNSRGFGNEVMKVDFIQDLVAQTAVEIAEKANSMGEGEYKSHSERGRLVALGMVWADDFKSRKDDAENNTLQKAAYPLQVVNND